MRSVSFLTALIFSLAAAAGPMAASANTLGDDAQRKAAEEYYNQEDSSPNEEELIVPPLEEETAPVEVLEEAPGEDEEAFDEDAAEPLDEAAAEPVSGERRIPIQSWNGAISVADKPFIKLADSNLDWEFYWSYTKEAPPRPLEEGIEIGVFVFAGKRETGGYQAVIEGLVIDGDEAAVQWVEVVPAEDALVTEALTYPWAVALFRHDGQELVLLDSPPDIRTAAPVDSGIIGLPDPETAPAPEVPEPEAEGAEVNDEALQEAVPEEDLTLEQRPDALPADEEQPLEERSAEEAPAEDRPVDAPIDLYLPQPIDTPEEEGDDSLSGTLY